MELTIEDFNTSRDDTRELALLVGREPAGRGLSSPGTALALSAASLTGAASFTTVAASLDEPAALLPRPASPCLLVTATLAVELSMSTFQMWHHSVDSHIMKSLVMLLRDNGTMDYVKTIEDVKFVLMAPMLVELAMKAFHTAHNADMLCSAMLFHSRTQSAMDTIRTVDRPPGNDQFVQLISFISGCYVSDHAAMDYVKTIEDVKFVLMAPMLVEVAMKAFHAARNADVLVAVRRLTTTATLAKRWPLNGSTLWDGCRSRDVYVHHPKTKYSFCQTYLETMAIIYLSWPLWDSGCGWLIEAKLQLQSR
ncbi:hypothetical protein TSPI_05938 [Trichinella spiralis]|uniref:Uncharacterized protein n=1 Tax=Trichinella spiralis TaxID=6334 RepID=A0ABR3KY45_TRISP